MANSDSTEQWKSATPTCTWCFAYLWSFTSLHHAVIYWCASAAAITAAAITSARIPSKESTDTLQSLQRVSAVLDNLISCTYPCNPTFQYCPSLSALGCLALWSKWRKPFSSSTDYLMLNNKENASQFIPRNHFIHPYIPFLDFCFSAKYIFKKIIGVFIHNTKINLPHAPSLLCTLPGQTVAAGWGGLQVHETHPLHADTHTHTCSFLLSILISHILRSDRQNTTFFT